MTYQEYKQLPNIQPIDCSEQNGGVTYQRDIRTLGEMRQGRAFDRTVVRVVPSPLDRPGRLIHGLALRQYLQGKPPGPKNVNDFRMIVSSPTDIRPWHRRGWRWFLTRFVECT